MNRNLIALLLFLPLAGAFTRSSARPVDTVWIEPCIFNELYAEGIASPPQVWLRAPKALYDSAIVLKYAPDMKRLEEIGKTIAPCLLPNFGSTVMRFVGIGSCRAPLDPRRLVAQYYNLDSDRDIDSAKFEQAFEIARAMWMSRRKWLPGYIYAMKNESVNRGAPSSTSFLTSEWMRESYCGNELRIQWFDFELLKREDVRNGLYDELLYDKVEQWDSVLVIVQESVPCPDTGSMGQWFEFDQDSDSLDSEWVDAEPEEEPEETPEKKRKRLDSIAICELLRETEGRAESDTSIYCLYRFLGDFFREPYLAAQDARLREIGFAEGCERRILRWFFFEARREEGLSRDRLSHDLVKYHAKCFLSNPDSIWISKAKKLIESLVHESTGIPERFYIVRGDGELKMVIGLPHDEKIGKPLILQGEELQRTLDAMPEEDRERLLREVRYELCGIEPFFVPMWD